MQTQRYFNSETVRITYRSKQLITGLTDVKLDIWNNAGAKVVSAKTLTELGNGIYYYDHIPRTDGNFIYRIWCDSQPHDVEGSFASVGLNSPYWRKGGGGSVTSMTSKDIKPDERIDTIMKSIRQLAAQVSELATNIDDIRHGMDEQDKTLLSAMPAEELERKVFA